MTNHSKKVTLIHRRDRLRAEKIMQNRLFAHPSINVIWNKVVERFIEGGDPEGLVAIELRDTESDELSRLNVDGAFVAIGHSPATGIFRGQLKLDDQGYIEVQAGSTRTNIPGVFACGDVADRVYRQAITAAGTGCMAALDAERFLSDADFETHRQEETVEV